MRFFAIPDAIVFRVSGADAKRYLNARLTNDCRVLNPGDLCLAAALTAQGKTEALFTVICEADGNYLLVCDGGKRERVYEAFRRYVVADRIDVNDQSKTSMVLHLVCDSGAIPTLSGAAPLPAEGAATPLGTGVRYRHRRGFADGIDLVLSRGEASKLIAELQAIGSAEQISADEMEMARLKAQIPRFPVELNEQYLFSEAGMVEAISYQKGCYVGQEVMEKVAAYGRTPYRLCGITVAGFEKVPAGAEIKNHTQQACGSVVTAQLDSTESRWYGFARVRNAESAIELTLATDQRPLEIRSR